MSIKKPIGSLLFRKVIAVYCGSGRNVKELDVQNAEFFSVKSGGI